MGFLRRIVERLSQSQAEQRGAKLEALGKLDEACDAYFAANNTLDAARVLVARADTEADPTRRLALLRIAARRAPPGSAPALEAQRRAALLRLDLARQSPGAALPSEWLILAHELEAMQLLRDAGEAFGMAGDEENQTRVLVACGAIDALESALESARRDRSEKRDRDESWRQMRDLDAIGKRLEAMRVAQLWLDENPLDEAVAAFVRTVRDRLVRTGPIPLSISGQDVLVVVDCPVIIGRADSSVVLPSPALSRQHLELASSPQGLVVKDLGSRNGTFLAGARLDGAISVGAGLDLRLGGQVPCRISARPEGGALIELPGQTIVAPLGPFHIGPFELAVGTDAVRLRALEPSSTPVLNGLRADNVVDLSFGDEIRLHRDGPVLFQVART